MVNFVIGLLGSILSIQDASCTGQILYIDGVQAYRKDTAVGAHGDLRLEGLPFAPGQPVEVLVISKTPGSPTVGGRSLRDSVLDFREPFEPVAGEDWDALL